MTNDEALALIEEARGKHHATKSGSPKCWECEGEAWPCVAIRLADALEASLPREVQTVEAAYEQLIESSSLHEVIEEAIRQGSYCCQFGCGSGACETCDCCAAGWCISGRDGIPEDAEDRQRWLEVAAENNPVAAALLALTPPQNGEER